MLLPGEIAEQLTPDEYTALCEIVERSWNQGFGVIKVTPKKSGKAVEVELDDKTHYEIFFDSGKNQH
jgi:hypothetical protein